MDKSHLDRPRQRPVLEEIPWEIDVAAIERDLDNGDCYELSKRDVLLGRDIINIEVDFGNFAPLLLGLASRFRCILSLT